MQIIAVGIAKGGTGKTTTAAALAQAAKADKKKVLLIDLDPQSNATLFLGADQNKPGSYELLHSADPEGLLQKTEQGIMVISGSPDLATEKTTPASAKRLRDAIAPLKEKYDFMVIDTPPHIGELLFNALMAATGLLIPLDTDNSSIQGLYQIAAIAHQMEDRNPDFSIIGTCLTRYDNRPKVNRFLKDTIANIGKEIDAPFLLPIRAGVAIKEAQLFQKSLFDYAPKSKPAQDYLELYKLIKRKGKKNGK